MTAAAPKLAHRVTRRYGRVDATLASWLAMGDFGAVRKKKRRNGTDQVYVELPRKRRIWTLRLMDGSSIPFTDETARRTLERIRGLISEGMTADEAVSVFLPAAAVENTVEYKVELWLEIKRGESRDGDISPTYLRELERYAKAGGHFSFWNGIGIAGIEYATLEDWSHWLADRGLAAKTRWNVMAAFRSFVGWLYKRKHLKELPRDWPWPKPEETSPRVLTADAQRKLLAEIPKADRGVFLAMAHMGIRPGEAVAVLPSDFDGEWMTIRRARKGSRLSDPVRGTKTGNTRRLPVPEPVRDWIAEHSNPQPRFLDPGRPLFFNPRTGGAWTPTSLRRVWDKACRAVGGVSISIYEGTKHTFATDAQLRDVPERALQAYLGHKDVRSTRRYAVLGDGALIDVIGGRRAATGRQASRSDDTEEKE